MKNSKKETVKITLPEFRPNSADSVRRAMFKHNVLNPAIGRKKGKV